MIRIVTDNASDITVEQARSLNIDRVSLVTSFDDIPCPMDTGDDYALFYEKLAASEKLPVTSRPTPESYLSIFEEARKNGDHVLVLTLSSGLSGTCESAHVAKNMCGYENITIIDTQQAVMSQRILVERAVHLRDAGMPIGRIISEINDLKERVHVIGIIGSLKCLKKGGRIPPALATIGDALGIKPVITVKDGVIISAGKVRGMKAGANMAWKMLDAEDIDPEYPLVFGYTSDIGIVENFMRDTMPRYNVPDAKICQVCGIIGTHLGPDSMGVAYVAKKK
ncbi:MAG: DegV family protein [Clostridia bacterium]|nr:DegV family protein [Clostridia bacterium]